MKHRAPQFDLPIPNEPFRLIGETLPAPDPKPPTPRPDYTPLFDMIAPSASSASSAVNN